MDVAVENGNSLDSYFQTQTMHWFWLCIILIPDLPDVAILLIEHGAAINYKQVVDWRLLHKAAEKGNY